MKTEVIEMLEFPRRITRDQLPLEECEHAGNFLPSDIACVVCETRLECEWLYHGDESVDLTEKPLEASVDTLGSAVLYVDACVTRAGHRVQACHCEACDWLRRARQLHETVVRAR